MSAHSSRTYRYTQMRKTIIAASTHCAICHKPLAGPVEIDHVIPKVYGGQDTFDNMRAVHARCNRRRGSRLEPNQHSRKW